MKYILFLLGYFLVSPSLLHGQGANAKLDSLKRVLAQLPPEGRSLASDTLRVRVLCELGEKTTDVNQSISWLKQGLKTAIDRNYIKHCQRLTILLGRRNKTKGTYFEAISFYYQSLNYADSLGNEYAKAQCYQEIADSYQWLTRYDKCDSLYNLSLVIYEKNNLWEDYADCLNNLAIFYNFTKQHDKSIALLIECLSYSTYIKGKQSIPSFYSNLGAAYRDKGEFRTALNHFNRSLALQVKDDDTYRLPYAFTLGEVAKTYLLQKKADSAIAYAEKALKIGQQLGGTQFEVNEVLYKAYRLKGQFQESLVHLENSINANNNATSQDVTRRFNLLRFEYDNQKQQGEINKLNQNLERESLLRIFFITGLIALTLFGFWFWRNNGKLKAKNTQIESQQSEILSVNETLDNLNKNLEQKVADRTLELSQANEELIRKNDEIMAALTEGKTIERKRVAIELHDNLGAMLSGIKWRFQALDKDKLSAKEQEIYEGLLEMMSDAYSEVRLISHNMLPAELEKNGLKSALEKLVNDINQNGRLCMSLTFDAGLEKMNKHVELELYSICLEAVNNILKHAEASIATIRLTGEESYLNLRIKDNGKGIAEAQQNNGKGLKNLTNRVQTLNGTLTLNTTKGTTLSIRIPYYG